MHGRQIPKEGGERLRKASTREAQRAIGIEVAQRTLKAVHAHPRVAGVYIYPPFGSYRAVLKVVEALGSDYISAS